MITTSFGSFSDLFNCSHKSTAPKGTTGKPIFSYQEDFREKNFTTRIKSEVYLNKKTKKVEDAVVRFHDNFVFVDQGYKARLYEIHQESKISVIPTFIGTFVKSEAGKKFIIVDGTKYYIKKGDLNTQYLKESD